MSAWLASRAAGRIHPAGVLAAPAARAKPAYDLAGTPTTGLTVQACGDAHLSNFGVFASPERRLVFDIKRLAEGAAKAMTRDSLQAFSKLTHLVDGKPRIIADPPLIVPMSDLPPEQADSAGVEQQLGDLLTKYRRTLATDRRYLFEQFEFVDIARKVAGVGSVGTRCWIVLMLGRDQTERDHEALAKAAPSGRIHAESGV